MDPKTNSENWRAQVRDLLGRAAAVCAENEVDLDAFMRTAWNAYVEARPGLREYLEEMHLRAQLEAVRQNGRMGEA